MTDLDTANGGVPAPAGKAPPTGRRRARRDATATSKTSGSDITVSPVPPGPEFDLKSPQWYLNRELTWLEFNRRVLHEAQDERNPLLERLKFVAIVSANLDEFFMKRIGGLKQQVGARVQELTPDGRTPQQQIEECNIVVRELEEAQDRLMPVLLQELAAYDVRILSYAELSDQEKDGLRERYINDIYPLVTPQAVDPAHPFPFISNLSLNLLVTLHYPDEVESRLARVKVPVSGDIPRFLKLGDAYHYVALEDIMANNLDLLFPGMEIKACEVFHLIRNANTERDEANADDLMEMIELEVRDRRFAPIVRIKVQKDMDQTRRGMLAAELGLVEDTDVFEAEGLMARRQLFELVGIPITELHDTPHHPMDHPKLVGAPIIFHVIREHGSILLSHPYESFSTSVERFLRDASRDPKVLAIKMTLYRTSSDTKVISYLIDAAQNGKQVAVVVELKARFDEAANIRWAARMEEAGIHVTYGVVGLKTHCKTILVLRKDYNGLRRYAHVGTGNYHAGTARLYSDLGMLTCDEHIGKDLTELFNYLSTGYTPMRHYHKILPAPNLLKKSLLAKIRREVELHSAERPGLIQFKMNALEDVDITRALYEASQAGVHVDLVVRDTCRLRPGIPGLSENVQVISIVGRFLEHSRIYYFRNAGDEEYYIGSADTMKRNLERRVEVVAPVEAEPLQRQLRQILDAYLGDNRGAWDMQADGTYVQRQPGDSKERSAQAILTALAETRRKAARQLKKRKSRGGSKRNIFR